MPMPTLRPIGRSGLRTAPLAFGCNVFGWTVDAPTAFRLLDAVVEAGCNLIDTANIYSLWVPGNEGGESETIIGQWLARNPSKRASTLIATKVGWDMGPGGKGLRADYILQACEASLKRLQTDHIDLYYSHTDDPSVPQEETLGAYQQLIEAGKVRVIGASNYSAERLAEALEISARHNLPRYEALQPPYNLYDRAEFEAELQPLCLREQISAIPYYGLAKGFLSGKYRSEADLGKSARGGSVGAYLNPRGFRILAALDDVAAKHNVRPASIALAWMMAQPAVTAPIASATSLEQLEDLLAATRLELSASELDTLTNASAEEAGATA